MVLLIRSIIIVWNRGEIKRGHSRATLQEATCAEKRSKLEDKHDRTNVSKIRLSSAKPKTDEIRGRLKITNVRFL